MKVRLFEVDGTLRDTGRDRDRLVFYAAFPIRQRTWLGLISNLSIGRSRLSFEMLWVRTFATKRARMTAVHAVTAFLVCP